MKYKINPKLKGTLTIPSIKNAVFKAGDTITLTEEQLIDKYISTAIKKDIIQKLVNLEIKKEKTKIIKKIEQEKNVEKTTNSGAWDADNKKLLNATESAKKTLEDLDIKDTMNVQSHDINLDLSTIEDKPVKAKKGRPTKAESVKKAKDALDKAVKDIDKTIKPVGRKKKAEILDLDRLTEEAEDDTDFVFDNAKNDKIDFVDLEEDRKRSRQNNQEIK